MALKIHYVWKVLSGGEGEPRILIDPPPLGPYYSPRTIHNDEFETEEDAVKELEVYLDGRFTWTEYTLLKVYTG